jgi:mono/diheme cytochrome c family protein
VAVALAAAVVIIAAGGAAVAWRPPIAPAAAPPTGFASAAIERGARVAALGDCVVCHTARQGQPFAGGRPLPTPFGTIYATNITPDPETGIGHWTEVAFRRAMRDGIARDGSHLYPALPYTHFTRATDSDLADLYAFVMTRAPVRASPPPNRLPFPLNIRAVVAGWNLLFLRPGPWQPDPTRSAEWNRGAYLVEAVGHCGACHTPRNALGAERGNDALAGGDAEGWLAPALDAGSPA